MNRLKRRRPPLIFIESSADFQPKLVKPRRRVKRDGWLRAAEIARWPLRGWRQVMQAGRGSRTGDYAGITGILVLNKPSGITSRKVVDQVARLAPRSKVGHAGTLDPLATGILIVCIGPATRLVENLQDLPKTYRTTVRLGAHSDTLDADGQIEIEQSPRIPSLHDIEQALHPLTGNVVQRPPAYSALKVEGRRAYDLARGASTGIGAASRAYRSDRSAPIPLAGSRARNRLW